MGGCVGKPPSARLRHLSDPYRAAHQPTDEDDDAIEPFVMVEHGSCEDSRIADEESSGETTGEPLEEHAETFTSPAAISSAHDAEKDKLERLKCLILVDLDNWPSFFKQLPFRIPETVLMGGSFSV